MLKLAMKSFALSRAPRPIAVMSNVLTDGAFMKSHEARKYYYAGERHGATADSNERLAILVAKALDSNAKADADGVE